MRLWVKILSIVIIVLVLIFIVTYIFLVFQGKALITKQLENLTKRKVSIGYFGLTFPLHLQIQNLNIEGLMRADSIFISPNILGFLTGTITFNSVKIIKPELFYEKVALKTQRPILTDTVASTSKGSSDLPLRLIFKRLKIKDGKIDFIDRQIGRDGIKITFKDIDFNLTNLYLFPRSVITNFNLNCRIPWREGKEKGRIEAEGWLNLLKNDMQAILKIEGIDGLYFYPYYSTWVDLEKARIEKAKLNFRSNIHSLNNDLTAECHLELTDIVFKPRPPGETQEKAEKIALAVLDVFKALTNGKIVLDFTIRTKMDRPRFGIGNIKMAFESRLNQGLKKDKFNIDDLIAFPGKLLEGTVRSATDLTKAVVNGTVSIGKEIKKVVEDTFKKEKKEE